MPNFKKGHELNHLFCVEMVGPILRVHLGNVSRTAWPIGRGSEVLVYAHHEGIDWWPERLDKIVSEHDFHGEGPPRWFVERP